MTNYVDGLAALATFTSYSNMTPAHCLEYVWDAYHAHGAQSAQSYPTAMAAYNATGGRHPGDLNPPAGYPVWFGPDPASAAGDVGFSAGGGMMWGVWGTGVHEVSIAQRSAEVGRPYLGWTENFMTDNVIVPGVGRNVTLRPTKDVQAQLGIPAAQQDGIYGPQTTWYVRSFQIARGLTVDDIYGPQTDLALFPHTPIPGVVAEGFDASTSRPAPATCTATGRTFIVVYVGAYDGDPRAVTKDEVTAYLNAGVSVAFVYEGSGKDASSFANGVGDATYAQGRLAALGYPDAKLHFAVDEQFAADPVDYFKGVESVIGHDRSEAYGSLDTLTALQAAGLCTGYWLTYAWLTYAWLNGRPLPDWVTLYQYLNGQTVNGHAVDYDHALKSDFGQVVAATVTTVPPVQPPKPVQPPQLVVDGVLGAKSITRWQQVMGTPVDGTISTPSDLVRAVQAHLNAAGARDWQGKSLVVDGLGIAQNGVKYRTVWALQAYFGTPRDGVMSHPSSTVVKAIQSRLNTGRF